MVKLSILMPVYNREKYIGEAIKSILSQSFSDFEIIVVNDGSKDNSESIIKSFSDQRIKYIKQENRGEYATTNVLLKMASGKYITWVHSDDTLPQDSLKYRVEELDKCSEIDIIHGDIVKNDSAGRQTDLLEATNDEAATILKHYCESENQRTKNRYFVHHLTFMFRRDVIEKVGFFDETLPFGGDLDWMLRAMKVCTFKRVPQVLYNYRRHKETVSIIAQDSGIKIHEVTKSIQGRHCNIND